MTISDIVSPKYENQRRLFNRDNTLDTSLGRNITEFFQKDDNLGLVETYSLPHVTPIKETNIVGRKKHW